MLLVVVVPTPGRRVRGGRTARTRP